MRIAELYPGAELYREDKVITAAFSRPQAVLSTGGVNGGAAAGITRICNCRVSEPEKHDGLFADHPGIPDLSVYFSEKAGVPPGAAVFLFTAANMNNGVWKTETYKGSTAAAVCTAGAAGNAVRAGDPASYYEEKGAFYPLGTINLIVAVNRALSPGASCGAVLTACEAKTAVLQELQIASNYSSGTATGTGTDQIAVASPETAGPEVFDTGTHSKWGEMIAAVCKAAVREALELQDGITPVQRGYAPALLRRFGVTPEAFYEGVASCLEKADREMLLNNMGSMQRDCMITSALSALLHQFDLSRWGMVPEPCRREVFIYSAAGLAGAVAGRYGEGGDFISELRAAFPRESGEAPAAETLVRLIFRAFAAGVKKRWVK